MFIHLHWARCIGASAPTRLGRGCIAAVATLLLAASAFAQTNPAPQALPYAQDFSTLDHASTEYPAGWQGWRLANSNPPSTFRTTGPTDDEELIGGSSSSTTSLGVHNYDGKIGFLVGGNRDFAIALAINTTGASNVLVSYDAMTMRNPGTRINEMALQYRVGTEGPFVTLPSTAYRNNLESNTNGTEPQNVQGRSVMLPAEAWDQLEVQLRWLSREIEGAAGRPSFAVTNVSIAQFDDPLILTSVDVLDPFETIEGVPSDAQTYQVSGFNLSENISVVAPTGFEISLDGIAYFGSLLIPETDGSAAAEVYVRLTGADLGEPSGAISHTSSGADPRSVEVSGSVVEPVPTIHLSVASLSPFTTEVGEPSDAQSYTVTGEHLEDDILVTAPAGFEVSDDGLTFQTSVIVAEEDGLAEATIHVRLTGAAIGTYEGDVSHTSDGADPQLLAVSGSVVDPALDVFVSADPTVAESVTLYPNDAWFDTGIENDWRFDDAELAFYLVPRVGAEFFAAEMTVTWDDAVLELLEVSAGDGLFSGGEGAATFLYDQLGSPNSVTVNASLLDNENVVITDLSGGDQYIARIVFSLLDPGATTVELPFVDLRYNDGAGGASSVDAQGHGGAVRALLGDVTAPGNESTGDGLVDFEDLVLFAAAYWSGVPGGPDPDGESYKYKFDVGPTVDGTVFSMPQIDGQIQFEDLVIFSLSYGLSANDLYPIPAPDGVPAPGQATTPETIARIGLLPARLAEGELRIPIAVDGVEDLRAFTTRFIIDTERFDVIGTVHGPSEIVDWDAVMFTAAFAEQGEGMADAAKLGGTGLHGSGVVMELRVAPRRENAAELEGSTEIAKLVSAELRSSSNTTLPALLGLPGAGDESDGPAGFAIGTNFPNPFAESTSIAYQVPETAHVRIALFDSVGREVAVLVDGLHDPGEYRTTLRAEALASGIYFYRMQAGAFVEARALTIAR